MFQAGRHMGMAMYLFAFWGCSPSTPNELDKLGTVTVSLKGVPHRLWIADEFEEQQKGLMFVTAEQMAPLPDGTHRGMLFVFAHEQTNSFWMKNTIIPLDIAYIASDGRVIRTYTMAPLDASVNKYPPGAAYRYTIEVNADRFADLGLKAGDVVEIPDLPVNR